MSDELSVPATLLLSAPANAMPNLTPAGLRKQFGPRSSWSVEVGDLWRATTGTTIALVVVTRSDASGLRVAPATVDPPAQDSHSLIVESERSPLRAQLTVWLGLDGTVSPAVLDRPIARLGADVAAWLSARGEDDQLGIPSHCRMGVDAFTVFDVANDVEAEQADLMDVLGRAHAIAQADGSPEGESGAAPTSEQLRALSERLKWRLPQVLNAIDGDTTTTEEERTIFREVLGRVPSAKPASPELVEELSQPRNRAVVRQWALKVRLPEPQARLDVAYNCQSMAARAERGETTEWRDRITRWAAAQAIDVDEE